jgi:serine/threonine protein kinase
MKDVERSILSELPWDPYVNGMVQTFHDTRNLYLMLEFVPCGTLRSIIQKRAPLDLATATFYFANIVCALHYLELYGIMHRDIKPDNILVGADGYLCLADFGTAAKLTEESGWQLNGTAAYMAPEVIASVGQSQRIWSGVDWWSSGCVLHEMITKKMASPPFRSPGIFTNIEFYRHFLDVQRKPPLIKWCLAIMIGLPWSELGKTSNPSSPAC